MTQDQWTVDHQDHAGIQSAATAAAQALSRVTDVGRIVLQTQASVIRQTVDLTWGTMVADLDRVIANKSYAESVARESARCWRTVGELSFHYATDLFSVGKSVSTVVLREVAAAGRRAAAGVPNPDSARRKQKVALRGSVGQRAEGTLMVANRHPRPRRIQLRAGDLVDSTGAPVAAALDISPSTVTVASGQERIVKVAVSLDDDAFSAGQQYCATLDVSGGDKATIEVEVSAEVEALSPVPLRRGRKMSRNGAGSPAEERVPAAEDLTSVEGLSAARSLGASEDLVAAEERGAAEQRQAAEQRVGGGQP